MIVYIENKTKRYKGYKYVVGEFTSVKDNELKVCHVYVCIPEKHILHKAPDSVVKDNINYPREVSYREDGVKLDNKRIPECLVCWYYKDEFIDRSDIKKDIKDVINQMITLDSEGITDAYISLKVKIPYLKQYSDKQALNVSLDYKIKEVYMRTNMQVLGHKFISKSEAE